ncbi:MAG: response regulator transcription factor [Peptococcaceae bacterium]|nr:response regulator transcription factor [Peptococcaceae bacterium]
MCGNHKILVIDDDRNICDLLQLYLAQDGHSLVFAHDGSQGLDAFKRESPDLVILDIMLPVINGWEVCRMIRQQSNVPIIMLTARDTSEEKISGLDMGADDYVIKPFDPREVAARVRARLRKKDSGGDAAGRDVLVAGDLSLDKKKYEVVCRGRPVTLTPKEIQLLHYLMLNKNMVLTREQILEKVWGYDYVGETRTVDMHVKKIREKLQPGAGWEIRTVHGVGYKFEVK